MTDETLTAPRLDGVVAETLAMREVAHGVAAPSVGRIVHTENVHGECLAAIVSGIHDGRLAVTVFHPDRPPEPWRLDEGEWHWPERNAG